MHEEMVKFDNLSFKEVTIKGPVISEKVIESSPYLQYDYGKIKINNTLSDDIYIPYNMETNHFFIAGAPGSGKTQFLFPFLEQVRKRKDKVFLYDLKGDFTQSISVVEGSQIILLAPWDKRGFAWRIGEDIYNPQLAREFALRIIHDTEEPIYATSARMILAGIIIYLQKELGTRWGINDLISTLLQEREGLYNILKDYAPEAAEIIREPTKLTQNVLTNLFSSISLLLDLAEFWKNAKHSFSVKDLINRETPFTFVMQGHGLYKSMSNALISSVVMAASAEIEMLTDSKERRLWFFLDELPQLGELSGLTTLLEIGRSKGACVVLATQNLNQLINIYGEDTAYSIQAMCNTHIYCRVSVGKTANSISENLGVREVIRQSPLTNSLGFAQGYSYVKEYSPSVPSFFLSNELGAKEDGINILLVGVDQNYIKCKIPYFLIKKIRKRVVF